MSVKLTTPTRRPDKLAPGSAEAGIEVDTDAVKEGGDELKEERGAEDGVCGYWKGEMGLWGGRALPFWWVLLPWFPETKVADEGEGSWAPVLPTAGPAMLLV